MIQDEHTTAFQGPGFALVKYGHKPHLNCGSGIPYKTVLLSTICEFRVSGRVVIRTMIEPK